MGIMMVEHYFDIETTGLDPKHNKIITIQIQELIGLTGEPIGEIKILKEWEFSEREIIEKIMPFLTCINPFDFIIVGKNLLFDFMFLSERAQKYGLKDLDLHCVYTRAFTDLKHVLVMINRGNFKGYDKLLKEGKLTNADIPKLYEQKKFGEIIEYVKEEATIVMNVYQTLRKEMPLLTKYLQTTS